jgi:hypothetical protein
MIRITREVLSIIYAAELCICTFSLLAEDGTIDLFLLQSVCFHSVKLMEKMYSAYPFIVLTVRHVSV